MTTFTVGFDVFAKDRATPVFDHMGDSASTATSKLARLGSVAGHALLGLGAAIGTATVASATLGVKTAAANEQASIAFTTMLGSAQKAGAFLKGLQAFAAKTPFEFPELQTAASSLISAGVNANKVIPIMTTLGNVTSGMGTGAEGVQRATIALQQMTAAGRISGEDLNQLRDAGIPVYDLLAKATGKSKEEVVKLAQAGKLGKKELGQMMAALESGKGLERFAGLMDKQSASLTGMWSTFKDTLGQGLATAIQPMIPVLKDGLGRATQFVADQMPRLAAGLASVKSVNFAAVMVVVGEAFAKLGPVVTGFIHEMPKFDSVARSAGQVLGFLGDHADLLAKALPFVVAGFALFKTAQMANNVVGKNSIIGFGLQTVATFTLAASNRSLAAAIASTTTVQNTGIIASMRAKVAIIAQAVASGTVAVASKAWAAAQWLLNAALTANPIGLVVVAIGALVAGLVYAYNHSETFREIVSTAFFVIKDAALNLALYAVKAFHFMLNVWLTVAGGIVNGAAMAFGWVPGLGPKLQTAAANFNTFKDKVNGTLSKVETDLEVTIATDRAKRQAEAMAKYYRDRNWTATAALNVNMVYGGNGRPIPARAGGGRVTKGQPYAVGDNPDGSWNSTTELFMPGSDGYIVNSRDTARLLGGGTPLAMGGGDGGTLNGTVQLVLDGRVIHEALLRFKRSGGGMEMGLA